MFIEFIDEPNAEEQKNVEEQKHRPPKNAEKQKSIMDPKQVLPKKEEVQKNAAEPKQILPKKEEVQKSAAEPKQVLPKKEEVQKSTAEPKQMLPKKEEVQKSTAEPKQVLPKNAEKLTTLTTPPPLLKGKAVSIKKQTLVIILALIILSNLLTVYFINKNQQQHHATTAASALGTPNQETYNLYLMDQASKYVLDTDRFEKKVRSVSKAIGIPPEWLMAVIYSESKFDASAINKQGNGATGLIQWKPATAQGLGVTTEILRNLNHEQQLDYVEAYLKAMQQEQGTFNSLTDLYTAIQFPSAIGKDYCYTLYNKSEKEYTDHKILDSNKDGRITLKDIDDRMKRMFPTAYMSEKKQAKWTWLSWLVH